MQLNNAYGDALSDDGTPMPLLTLGMGKLGGGELNFSSDLDLIFAYPYDGETKGKPRSLTHKRVLYKNSTANSKHALR